MVDAKALKELGIFLKDTDLLTMAYGLYRGIALLPLAAGKNVLVLDLDNLPSKPIPCKEIFIRWWLQVNEPRILKGEDPVITYSIAKMCPIWKLIPMPIRPIGVSKLHKLPSIKTISQQIKPTGIK
jgi:hypothetical protein